PLGSEIEGGCVAARATSIAKIGRFSNTNCRWLVRLMAALVSCVAIANAQSSMPTEPGNVSDGISIKDSTSPTKNSPADTREHASQAAGKPGSIVGTILDQSGAVSVGTVVRVTSEDKSFSRDVVSGNNGQYSFSNVPPGQFKLSVNSTGFGDQAFFG